MLCKCSGKYIDIYFILKITCSDNFYYMSVSCPSGLCFSASLPLVTSQARLESDVLEPQPGVTAGFRRMFQALGVQDWYPGVPSASLYRLGCM